MAAVRYNAALHFSYGDIFSVTAVSMVVARVAGVNLTSEHLQPSYSLLINDNKKEEMFKTETYTTHGICTCHLNRKSKGGVKGYPFP